MPGMPIDFPDHVTKGTAKTRIESVPRAVASGVTLDTLATARSTDHAASLAPLVQDCIFLALFASSRLSSLPSG